MSYEKMTPIEGGHGGCLNCGFQHAVLPMDSIIAVGFGCAQVTKSGAVVYDENEVERLPEERRVYWQAKDAELLARNEPDKDWRIHLVAPLSERHYQRQGENHWVLYEKGEGFA